MGILARHLGKSFGEPPTEVLRAVNLEIRDGEFVAITGKSGSGKSTLLYALSSLDPPTKGLVTIDGHDVYSMEVDEVHRFRNHHMGFVFQFHYLLPELTALENILMPALRNGDREKRRPWALELMGEFGLEGKERRFPSQLSGGEQQRVAIARALVMEPKYLFADEPTGNLDTANGDVVMRIFQRLNAEKGMTVIYVTHDPDFAALARRQVMMVDGRIARD
ncbi:MAG: ABC transporter ATP-binding protein [Bdellovibrionales bacterium]|nr:ABC transporter ATP-binding protein [Bdellovibrionales bacterium]